MPKYKVSYSGWYIIEADSEADALETDRDDFDVEYEEYENEEATYLEADNG